MSEQSVSGRRRAGDRGGLAATLVSVAVGAALVLSAAGQTWAHGTVRAATGMVRVHVSGGQVSGVPSALALIGLAGVVAVFAVRGLGRRLVGLLITLAGAGCVVTALLGASGHAALDDAAAKAVGVSRATAGGVGHELWPWLSALGGLFVLVAGLLTLLRGSLWPSMGARYDAPGERSTEATRARAAASGRPDELWKALDRGEDPTADLANGAAKDPGRADGSHTGHNGNGEDTAASASRIAR